MIPDALAVWVANHALRAVAQHIAGEPVTECPWQAGDPDPLHRALYGLWWNRHLRFLADYRDDRPFN